MRFILIVTALLSGRSACAGAPACFDAFRIVYLDDFIVAGQARRLHAVLDQVHDIGAQLGRSIPVPSNHRVDHDLHQLGLILFRIDQLIVELEKGQHALIRGPITMGQIDRIEGAMYRIMQLLGDIHRGRTVPEEVIIELKLAIAVGS